MFAQYASVKSSANNNYRIEVNKQLQNPRADVLEMKEI
jgi:hypothetical protein